ncbi:PKD domain-containing protein, partial [Dehalococcoidia bacterium]|nr:PKD domain-containing protein [Dehalococcoidia bacterium]
MGASIQLPGRSPLSDPANDRQVAIVSGSSTDQRSFVIPADAPPGRYNLLVSLVEDVNNNGRIDAGDRSLASRTFTEALQVTPPAPPYKTAFFKISGDDWRIKGSAPIYVDEEKRIVELTVHNSLDMWVEFKPRFIREDVTLESIDGFMEHLQKESFGNYFRLVPPKGSVTYTVKLNTLLPGDILEVEMAIVHVAIAMELLSAALGVFGVPAEPKFALQLYIEFEDHEHLKEVVEYIQSRTLLQMGQLVLTPGTIVFCPEGREVVLNSLPPLLLDIAKSDTVREYGKGWVIDRLLAPINLIRAAGNTLVSLGIGVYQDFWRGNPIIEFALVTFISEDVTLSMDIIGEGTVNKPGDTIFPRGELKQVEIRAYPAPGWKFVGWKGDVGTIADVHAPVTTIRMDSHKNIAAHFIRREFLNILPADLRVVAFASPGELRVYDSQGRVTGLVDGVVKEEIPYSMYDTENKIVTIFAPTGIYYLEVAGIEEATYRLTTISSVEGQIESFAITDVPTTETTTHRFVIDTEVPVEAGVTMKTDADGDGVFEEQRMLQQPIASFAYSPEEMIVDQPITFDASGSSDPDGEIMSYEWDFGDGTTGTGRVIEHSFSVAGDYMVTLTIADNDGVVNSFSKRVEVVLPQAPDIGERLLGIGERLLGIGERLLAFAERLLAQLIQLVQANPWIAAGIAALGLLI